MRPCGLILASLAVGALVPAQGVTLRELPDLARHRSERQRPAQLAKLEPYLADLRTDYRRNASILDQSIVKVAELGDAVVPLLIDYLTPKDTSDNQARWLSANSTRVLELLEPRVHLDAWLELLAGDHPLGRRAALRLLSASGPDPRSAAALTRAFPQLKDPWDVVRALETATRLDTPALAPLAVPALRSPEPAVRAAVLEYLTRSGYADAAQTVVVALRRETENALLGRYIAYLRATVRGDAAVADALIPLIEGVRLDPDDLRDIVEALATVAPSGHKESRRVLLALLERGESGSLGIRAALTLRALGEKRGPRLLFETLQERLRQRRGEAGVYADRAEAFFAFGQHKDSIRDYEQAIKYSSSHSREAAYHLQIARCEAHRDNIQRMIHAMRDSRVSAATIRAEAGKDPIFLEKLQTDAAVRFLESIGR